MKNSLKAFHLVTIFGTFASSVLAAPNHNHQDLPFTPANVYPGFNRTCLRSPDCNFAPSTTSEKVWLLCEYRACICDRNIYIAFAKSWGLKWDGKTCTHGKHGPCGTNNGLTIGCQEGLTCDPVRHKCVKDHVTRVEQEPGLVIRASRPIVVTTTTLPDTTDDIEEMSEESESEIIPVTTTLTSLTSRVPATRALRGPKVEDLPKPRSPFYRPCQRSTDCQFKPSEHSGRAWLSCEDNVCACTKYPNLVTVNDVQIRWNGTDCTVGLGDPCGEDNGLTIICRKGNVCLGGMCRTVPHSVQEGHTCNEDVDCMQGLGCKFIGFESRPIKKCVQSDESEVEEVDPNTTASEVISE